ncbi:Protein of unknown function [Caldanaerobius fijiensis DSM 17918]|uniref:DUF2922 domain-containing protein n=1 Tax=Caldanaerobius fijiensis DSM 17918 TaxID=1121256 RepID=A0A1M5DFN2_9THEO|nr:DUF2922 domain-containing protein [Caldanaerobius fijiensis]SHF65779.1 Protein of unknown function [Caldanaerobius fijiensis DSM 17918]
MKTLIMVFRNSIGRLVRISVDNVRDDITEADIKNAMGTLVAKNVFEISNGELKEPISASIVTTQTQEFDLVL